MRSFDLLSPLEREIVRYVARMGLFPTRQTILLEFKQMYKAREVEETFKKLRKEGVIYRLKEGWYQTDLSVS